MKKIDLHIHSNCSDGVLTPKQIIDESVKNNVEVISIADHDTIEAYSEDLFEYSKSKNIKLIPAVEISTKGKKAGIHILGYNFDLSNEIFKENLKKIRNSRHDYLHNVTVKLEKLGYKINLEKLDKIDSVTKAHISLDIISNKENEKLLLETFGYIPTKGDFIETIMNEGCPAYVSKLTITPKEASTMIRNAGGIVVLAHPVAYVHEDNITTQDIQDLVNEIKPDGIEANYLYVDKYDNFFDECLYWNNFAEKNHLFTTMGSDFHNKDNIRPEIGAVNERLKLDDNKINLIIENVTK